MRKRADAETIKRFCSELGRAAKGPGRVYLVGGASAVLLGFRDSTVDVDMKLDPEPAGVFDAIPRLKRELALNVELAAPDDFIPPLHDWRERSSFISCEGSVELFHYDFRAQALAKIERGHAQDVVDVQEMLRRGLVSPAQLRAAFVDVERGIARYPAVDIERFREQLERMMGTGDED